MNGTDPKDVKKGGKEDRGLVALRWSRLCPMRAWQVAVALAINEVSQPGGSQRHGLHDRQLQHGSYGCDTVFPCKLFFLMQ